MNGAEWLVRELRDRGVENVFVLCGNGLNPFLDACRKYRLRLIDVRNEQAASYMADLWGRLTRRMGVVAVSSGPGHTNALTGLANAFWDGGPMLLVSGCSEAATRGLDHFQELDQVAMAAPVCKYAAFVYNAPQLRTATRQAIAAAVTPRPGPVHLTVPVDVFNAEVPPELVRDRCRVPACVDQHSPGDADLVREAVEALHKAKRPLIIVGSGAFYADAAEPLQKFVALTGISLISQLWDRACVEQPVPEYLGVTTSELNGAFPLVARCDVVLVVGARIDYRLGYGRPPIFSSKVRFVRVGADPAEVVRTVEPEIGIVGDPRSVLEQMLVEAERLGSWNHKAWLQRMRRARDAFVHRWETAGHESDYPMPGFRICLELRRFLREDVTFLLDGGNIGRWAHALFFERHPAHWATCGASGVVGWGIPGAVAAKMARPNHPVLLLSGDGAAGFTLAEIETALRFGTPYVAVVAHDAAWGIVADGQAQGKEVASLLGEIRFDRVAEALGAKGVYIEHPSQLAPTVERALNEDTVTFVHVPMRRVGIRRWKD